MTDLIKQSIGRYHILEQLGEGGMAVVYKAYDTFLECDVAVKVIRTERLENEYLARTLARFQLEARSLAKLTHPNIIKVMDYGVYQSQPYLVMPYLPGGTLKDFLVKPLNPQKAARLLTPIAQALSYAHQKGFIHRDVKPSNILMTETGLPMLSDFGIAKILEPEETIDITGTMVGVGTPEYMAPEQGLGRMIDQRVDIYALGIVFYELVTGRKPFRADTPVAVMIKHIHDPLPRPRKFVPSLSRGVESLLFKALAKEPDNRFTDMDNMATVLQLLGEGKPTGLGIFSSNQLILKVGLGLVVLVSLISTQFLIRYLILPWFDEGEIPSRPTLSIEVPPLFNGTETISFETQGITPIPSSSVSAAPIDTPSVTPSMTPSNSPTLSVTSTAVAAWKQGKLAVVSKYGNGDGIFLIDLARNLDLSLLIAPENGGRLMAPSWSPDSSRIAYHQYMGNMYILNTITGEFRTYHNCKHPSWHPSGEKLLCYNNQEITFDIVEASTGHILNQITAPAGSTLPAWSPVESRIVFSKFDAEKTSIWWMDLNNLFPILMEDGADENYAPSWSPDGQWIAYQSTMNASNSDLWIMDLNGGNKQRVTNTVGDTWSRAPSWSPDGKWLVFVSNRVGSIGADYGEVFIVSLATKEVIQITQTGGLVYDWRVSWGK